MVVADVEVEVAYQFERRWYGSNPEQLQRLAEWLIEQRVEEVVIPPIFFLYGISGIILDKTYSK